MKILLLFLGGFILLALIWLWISKIVQSIRTKRQLQQELQILKLQVEEIDFNQAERDLINLQQRSHELFLYIDKVYSKK